MNDNRSPSNIALAVMDVQRTKPSYFGPDGAFIGGAQGFLDRLAHAIRLARTSGIMVIHVAWCFRDGNPEVSPRNRLLSGFRTSGRLPAAPEFHPAVAPGPGEVIVTRSRVSAFTGSDFEVILRAHAVDQLVLCGIATGGVVLATLLEAADKDYQLTVLCDCCANVDEEVQRTLLTKIFPRYADVLTVEEWGRSIATFDESP